ncbi:MAG: DUF3999 domain-containing protein, partial [Rhizobacter sp.]|nr:DUF3999 domain-containing protein [Rhizobacter sp.]
IAAGPEEPAFRFRAPIEVQQSAAFVLLPLPASAYDRSLQPGLADLRVIDARGARVPFALLAPRPREVQRVEQQRDATLYPLPPRPAAGKTWVAPVELVVQGDRISVRRLGEAPTSTAAAAPSPGWLIDMGERKHDDPRPASLRLAWSGPAEFSTAYSFETSDDLRSWQHGGSGQLMALASPSGPLTQPTVALPAAPRRFVRLVWGDVAAAPVLTAAQVVAATLRRVAIDAPTELQFSAGAEPQGKAELDDAAKRALHFDLGGTLPLEQIELLLGAGTTRVAPVRIQGRTKIDEPWRELAHAVFYRLEHGAEVATSPALEVSVRVRYLRVLADERATPLDPAATRLAVRAQLARLVFASQGEAPFSLLAGSADGATGALPVATLVPSLEDERKRFGSASLGEWSEVAAVAKQVQAQQRRAELRPWLLWAVLLLGVGGLGFMVWRLARSGRAGA